jgi:hypothetical protein
MAEKLLDVLNHYLQEEGMDSAVFDADSQVPQGRLVVYLGRDQLERERILEITATEQMMPANVKASGTNEVETGFYRLEIRSRVPIETNFRAAADMASSLNFLNGMLELPGLFYDEVTNHVFYRYVQVMAGSEFNKTLLLAIVGMHRMVLDVFTDLLAKIGSGEMTYFELLEQIVKYTAPSLKKAA